MSAMTRTEWMRVLVSIVAVLTALSLMPGTGGLSLFS